MDDIKSLAQGKYPWGIIKMKKLNSKFAVGKDKSFPTFQINKRYTICVPTPRIFAQGILYKNKHISIDIYIKANQKTV